MSHPYYILSLDGGGSLGVYTLGILAEIEQMLDKPLHEKFDLIYGTSTGAIIASLIALGKNIESIQDCYFQFVPAVMGKKFARTRSKSLRHFADKVFGNNKFDKFIINIGIVATDLESRNPIVFKSNFAQAHGRSASFLPGFGCTIADAVVASCAARPYFKAVQLDTSQYETRKIIDGGFIANNPSLFALTDALCALQKQPKDICILSIGTGSFPVRHQFAIKFIEKFSPTFSTLARASSNTVDTLFSLLFKDIYVVRIDESFADSRYRTNFLENRNDKLKQIFQLGRCSFGSNEVELKNFFEPKKQKEIKSI